MDAAVMERLSSNPWPGNVRELKNVLERAILLANGAGWDWSIPRSRRRSSLSLSASGEPLPRILTGWRKNT